MARGLFLAYGLRVGQDRHLKELFKRYREAIHHTGEAMQRLGVTEACTRCALEGMGSCCFAGVENNYDAVLLFINLFFGCELTESPEIAGKCLFVGKEGCKLVARHYYCLRFFCDELRAALGSAGVGCLNETIGRELGLGLELEHGLRQFWRRLQRDNFLAGRS